MFLTTDEFYLKNYIYKVFYVIMTYFTKRLQFYYVFRMQENSCIASGLGYNGVKDGEHQWDRIIGGFCMRIEKDYNPQSNLKVSLKLRVMPCIVLEPPYPCIPEELCFLETT